MKPLTQKILGENPGMSFRVQTNAGKPSREKRWAKARLTKAINRYSCAQLVGAGFRKWLVGVDQPGAEIKVTSIWANGVVSVELLNGGVSTLGMADIEIYDTLDLTKEELDFIATVDKSKSLVQDQEIISP